FIIVYYIMINLRIYKLKEQEFSVFLYNNYFFKKVILVITHDYDINKNRCTSELILIYKDRANNWDYKVQIFSMPKEVINLIIMELPEKDRTDYMKIFTKFSDFYIETANGM